MASLRSNVRRAGEIRATKHTTPGKAPGCCRGCADAYGRLVTALARFHTVGRLAAVTGEHQSSIHERLAGTEPIDRASWDALKRAARFQRFATEAGTCAHCGGAVVREGKRAAGPVGAGGSGWR